MLNKSKIVVTGGSGRFGKVLKKEDISRMYGLDPEDILIDPMQRIIMKTF